MKNAPIIIAAITFLGLGISTANAEVSVGLHLGTPYYRTPPAYYVPADDAMWMGTPVEVIYIDGRPHQMHMWKGRWYDESWSSRHSDRNDHRDSVKVRYHDNRRDNDRDRYRDDWRYNDRGRYHDNWRDNDFHGGRRW